MKPSTAKTKGRETENLAATWLANRLGYSIERRRLSGSADRGDLSGLPDTVVEVKSAAHWSPLRWLREAETERQNDKARLGVVVARPKGKPNPDDWVVIMSMDSFAELWEPWSDAQT